MITDSQALLNTGQIIFGIIVIGLIGLVSDFAVQGGQPRLFPWSTGVTQAEHRSRRLAHVPGAPAARRREALQPTDLSVADNDFITILGPSGCGKVTLLRIVAGLDRADERPRPARRQAR